MRTSVPLTEKQRKAMLPYKQNVGEIYRTLDWLRDSILNENGNEFDTALHDLHCQFRKRVRARHGALVPSPRAE